MLLWQTRVVSDMMMTRALLLCTGGKLGSGKRTHMSAAFDNSPVAGGFVPWTAEWGRDWVEESAIREAMEVLFV